MPVTDRNHCKIYYDLKISAKIYLTLQTGYSELPNQLPKNAMFLNIGLTSLASVKKLSRNKSVGMTIVCVRDSQGDIYYNLQTGNGILIVIIFY